MPSKAPKIILPPPPAPPPPPPPPTAPVIEFPGPSPEETALRASLLEDARTNRELAQQQLAQQRAAQAAFERAAGRPLAEIQAEQALAPIRQREAFLARVGITPEQAAAEEAAFQIASNRALAARAQLAFEGKLPVDPALERTLQEQAELLEATFRRQLGPGYTLSTPYLQARAEFDKRANETLFSARRGEISSAEQRLSGLLPSITRGLGAAQQPSVQLVQPGFLPVIPQASTLLTGLGNERTLATDVALRNAQLGLQSGLAGFNAQVENQRLGFQSQLDFLNRVNQANLAAAQAQGQAQAGLIGGLVQAGGLLGGSLLGNPSLFK